MSTFNPNRCTYTLPCFQLVDVRSEMLLEPSIHPAHNERAALLLVMIPLFLTRMAGHRYSSRSSKALPIPFHALEWVVCPVWHPEFLEECSGVGSYGWGLFVERNGFREFIVNWRAGTASKLT
jgi:hypothetical protein